jgi:hypothetical protein
MLLDLILRVKVKVKCTVVQALRLCTGRTVKCTVVQALRLCTGRTAYRGLEVYLYPFLTTALKGVRGQRHAPPLFTPGRNPVPFLQEAGCAPGPVWTGAENLAPHRESIPGPSSP